MKAISKNYYRTAPIRHAEDLQYLADNNKSVYHIFWGLKPAKVIIKMRFDDVLGSIKRQYLFFVDKIE